MFPDSLSLLKAGASGIVHVSCSPPLLALVGSPALYTTLLLPLPLPSLVTLLRPFGNAHETKGYEGDKGRCHTGHAHAA